MRAGIARKLSLLGRNHPEVVCRPFWIRLPSHCFPTLNLTIGHRLSALLLQALCLASFNAYSAVQVSYGAVDLTDTAAGEDLWRYDYRVQGISFAAGESLSIFFQSGQYSNIHPLSAPPNWISAAAEPDPILGPGLFVAQAQSSDPSTAIDFSVRFTWLGAGAPGSQSFELLGPDPDFDRIASGQTIVPEPRMWLIILIAVLAVCVHSALARLFFTSHQPEDASSCRFTPMC